MNDFREYSNYCDRYLAHHGIKGQHWGVKNGPPYPLDKKVSKAIKAGKNETRSSDDGRKVGTQHSAAAAGKTYTVNTNYLNSVGGWEGFHKLPEEEKKKWRDTDLNLKDVNQYNSGWKNAADMSNFKQMDELGWDYDKMVEKAYDKDMFIRKDIKQDYNKHGFDSDVGRYIVGKVNKWDEYDPYVQNNCSKCSDVMELVMRGINPEQISAGRSKFGMLTSANSYHWNGAVDYKEKSYENIENRIKKFGNKGSGTIGIRRADGSGHAMHFSTVKDRESGEYRIEVQDGQVGKIYKTLREALDAQGHDPNQFCRITRLDNATPNLEHMSEDSVFRMDPSKSYASGVKDLKLKENDIRINQWNVLNRNEHEWR